MKTKKAKPTSNQLASLRCTRKRGYPGTYLGNEDTKPIRLRAFYVELATGNCSCL